MSNINAFSPQLSGLPNKTVLHEKPSNTNAKESGPVLNQLQKQILSSLAEQIPGMSVDGFKKLDANEFTPEKVAGRIAGFVSRGMELARARGDSEEKIQALYDSAMKGVEEGFKQAKEILSGLDVLNGKIKEDVEKTEELTFDALSKLSPAYQQSAQITESMAQAQRYDKAETFELKLTTREGDNVTVKFGRSESLQSSSAMAQDGQGNQAMLMDVSRSESTNFYFSVEGDLNEQELEAIQNLVKDVSQVSNEFFNGDVQKAFEMTRELSMDTTQLQSMDMSLMRSETYAAVSQYQQTGQLGEEKDNQRPLKQLNQLMQAMRSQLDEQMQSLFEDAKAMQKNIMQSLVEQDSRFKLANEEQQDTYRQNLDTLFDTNENA